MARRISMRIEGNENIGGNAFLIHFLFIVVLDWIQPSNCFGSRDFIGRSEYGLCGWKDWDGEEGSQ
jgi:hypothetical protein